MVLAQSGIAVFDPAFRAPETHEGVAVSDLSNALADRHLQEQRLFLYGDPGLEKPGCTPQVPWKFSDTTVRY